MTSTPTAPHRTPPLASPNRVAPATLRVLGLPAWSPRPNPYNHLLCDALVDAGAVVEEFSWRRALSGRWDIMHVHWPEYFLRSRRAPWLSTFRKATSLAMLRAIKRRGVKIVWTVHNLKPHGLPAGTAWQPFEEFLELVDGCLFLSHSSCSAFVDRYPAARGTPDFVIPHGVYTEAYPQGVSRSEARRRLGLPADAVVAAAVGGVEPYKDLPRLIREFAAVGRSDLWLVVAGKPSNATLARTLREAAAGTPNILLQLEFIPDHELQNYFAAADLCITPYADILNSGSVLLALSFGCPVVGPAIGSLDEVRSQVGAHWMRTYEGPLNAAVLDAAIDWSLTPRSGGPNLQGMQWSTIARQTIEAYREIAYGLGVAVDSGGKTADESPGMA